MEIEFEIILLGHIEMSRLLICEGKVSSLLALIRGYNGQLVIKSKP